MFGIMECHTDASYYVTNACYVFNLKQAPLSDNLPHPIIS